MYSSTIHSYETPANMKTMHHAVNKLTSNIPTKTRKSKLEIYIFKKKTAFIKINPRTAPISHQHCTPTFIQQRVSQIGGRPYSERLEVEEGDDGEEEEENPANSAAAWKRSGYGSCAMGNVSMAEARQAPLVQFLPPSSFCCCSCCYCSPRAMPSP